MHSLVHTGQANVLEGLDELYNAGVVALHVHLTTETVRICLSNNHQDVEDP